jgi:hypothetical protein
VQNYKLKFKQEHYDQKQRSQTKEALKVIRRPSEAKASSSEASDQKHTKADSEVYQKLKTFRGYYIRS